MTQDELLTRWKTWYMSQDFDSEDSDQGWEDCDFLSIFIGFCGALGTDYETAVDLYYHWCVPNRLF